MSFPSSNMNSAIYKTPNYFLTFLLGPRGLSGTVQSHEKKTSNVNASDPPLTLSLLDWFIEDAVVDVVTIVSCANFSYELFSLWRPTHRDGWDQRQCFTPCSHLISTETGNAVETRCQNKSKQSLLWILPSKCIRGISYRHSRVVVLLSKWQEKQGGRELSRRMPQPSLPFLPLVSSVSCRRIYSTFQCLLSAPFFVFIALNITDTRLTWTPL